MIRNKILAYAFGPIGSGLLSLISLPLIAWFYTIEDVGKISMLRVAMSFIVLVFCLGLDQAYVREYYDYINKNQLFKLSISPGLILITPLLLLLLVAQPYLISNWLYGVDSIYLSLISVICFITAFFSRFLSLILRMEEKAFLYSLSQVIPKLLFLIFILTIVAIGFKGNLYNLIIAHTLSIITVFATLIWNTKHEWKNFFKFKLSWLNIKPLLEYGFPLMLAGLASWGLNVMDKVFLRSMSTFGELGIYSVAISIAGIASLFAGIFNTIWSPMVFKWIHQGVDNAKIEKMSGYVLVVIYFIIIIAGLSSWILTFFLPKTYIGIQYLIPLCLLPPLLYTLSETTSIGITIARRTKLAMIASMLALATNAIGNYILIPYFGAGGAALSTGISFTVFLIIRTEVSNFIWQKSSTIKIYLNVILLLISTIIHFLSSLNTSYRYYTYIMWLLLLIFGFYTFKQEINNIKKDYLNGF